MTQTTFDYAKEIRNLRDFHGKPTQTYTINGKTIKTNFGAYDYPYWNGNDIPEKYTHKERCGHRSSDETINKLIELGYDEIRIVVLASGMIRGYCEMYFFACKSKKAQSQKADKAETQNQPETINPERDYHVVEVNKSTSEKRDCGTWSGHGMSKDFKAGFNGFFKEDETSIWYATEMPETVPETENKEMNHPEPEKVTESKSQPIKRLNGAPRLIEDSEEDKAMTPIKINFCLDALRAQRAELARIQLKEYQTRGNTQRCQELWTQITKLDEEIARRTSK